MAAKHNINKNIAQFLNLPPEVMPNIPQLLLIGNERLVAENHRGISEYLTDKIIFNTGQGRVEVAGKHLLLASLSSDELVIEGDIMAVPLFKGGNHAAK